MNVKLMGLLGSVALAAVVTVSALDTKGNIVTGNDSLSEGPDISDNFPASDANHQASYDDGQENTLLRLLMM